MCLANVNSWLLVIQAVDYLSVVLINNRILVHREILSSSQITPRKLTRAQKHVWLIPLLWCLPKSIKQFIFVKENKETLVGSVLPLHLSVSAYQPHEKSLIHTDPLLICPADAAATTKSSVRPWQHDRLRFRQEWVGTPELSTLQSRIKWNMMKSQAGV